MFIVNVLGGDVYDRVYTQVGFGIGSITLFILSFLATRIWLPFRHLIVPAFNLVRFSWGIYYAFIYLVLNLIAQSIEFLVNKLRAKGSIRTIMVSIGIVVYIIGNIFQLVATFE